MNRIVKFYNRHPPLEAELAALIDREQSLIKKVRRLQDALALEGQLWSKNWQDREAQIRAPYEYVDWARVGIGIALGLGLGWMLGHWWR